MRPIPAAMPGLPATLAAPIARAARASLIAPGGARPVATRLTLAPLLTIAALATLPAPRVVSGEERSAAGGLPSVRSILADYDSEPRGPDGRVDVEALAGRMRELGAGTYYWLIWHAPTDWDDLKRFLPLARDAGMDVWVYLVPPSESPPHTQLYSEPFRLDYGRWAEEIARLSLDHPNLTAWVIDDFLANREVLTPEAVAAFRARSRSIHPRLAFLPLLYYGEVTRAFVDAYRKAIDGVVVAYPQDRSEIEAARGILDDALTMAPGTIAFPWSVPSRAGDHATVSQRANVLPGGPYRLVWREREDFTGPTAGYHFKELLVDGVAVREEDVAGGEATPREVAVDLTEAVKGKASVDLAFRLSDRKGVSNFGVRWRIEDLRAEGLRLSAPIEEPGKWSVERRGAFEVGFGEGVRAGTRAFHVPFVVMTAGDAGEFRQRHGDPASPDRMGSWLRMCLDAWRDGLCDGVVTYCLDKRAGSPIFDRARTLFAEFSPGALRRKKLVEFGWDEPDTAFLRKHLPEMERTPFDGCVFHVNSRRADGKTGSLTWGGWGKRAIEEGELAEALADLRALAPRRFTECFLRFNTTPADLDWFDDFSAVLANARTAARLAREGGCRGLLFDIEQYDKPLFAYRKARDAATRTWDDYAAQVRKRGREVMEAFQEGYPDPVVFLTFGYSLPWAQSGGGKTALSECSYGLLAPLLDGMVEAARGGARIVDGHELSYGYRTRAQFSEALRTMREGLLPIVADREKYRRVFSLGFGIWLDHDWRRAGWSAEDPAKNYFSPEALEVSARSALDEADEYVWIYSETPRWWSEAAGPEAGGPVKLPEAYAESLRRARAATSASGPR